MWSECISSWDGISSYSVLCVAPLCFHSNTWFRLVRQVSAGSAYTTENPFMCGSISGEVHVQLHDQLQRRVQRVFWLHTHANTWCRNLNLGIRSAKKNPSEGISPSCHRARGRVRPGQVASLRLLYVDWYFFIFLYVLWQKLMIYNYKAKIPKVI